LSHSIAIQSEIIKGPGNNDIENIKQQKLCNTAKAMLRKIIISLKQLFQQRKN
jgi:hypothetical protein